MSLENAHWKGLLKSVTRIILGVLVLAPLYLMFIEKQLIYYPSRALDGKPTDAGLPFEEATIEVEPGVTVHGWFIKAAKEPSVATILFSHGNAGNISNRVDRVHALRSLGVDFLLYDYRGYGKSTGSPDEEGTYRDGRAAYDYLVNVRHIDAKKIVLMGESLGCAISVQLALDRPAAGLVLEAPFASIVHMAREVYPFLPVGPFVRTRYDNLAKIPKLRMPLLLFHGTEDEVIPFNHGKMLADAAPEPKLFVSVNGAHHNDVYVVGGETYKRALAEFVQHAVPTAARPTLIEPAKP